MTRPAPQPGSVLPFYHLKADGSLYRSWKARILDADSGGFTTLSIPGSPVEGPGGGYMQKLTIRAHYWHGKMYDLLEVYRPDPAAPLERPFHELQEIYMNIASPPAAYGDGEAAGIAYRDFELDVVCKAGGTPFLADEDEFQAAIPLYGFSAEFVEQCYTAAWEAMGVAGGWMEQLLGNHPRQESV